MSDKSVKVTQIASPIRRPGDQRATLEALGLTRIGKSRVHKDTPALRGRIFKVKHMVRVEPVEG